MKLEKEDWNHWLKITLRIIASLFIFLAFTVDSSALFAPVATRYLLVGIFLILISNWLEEKR